MAYTYDPTTGNLASLTAPGGIGLSFTYDGSLPTGFSWSGPIQGSVSRGYDNQFRRSSLAVNGTSPIVFQYDRDNLLVQAGPLALSRDPQNVLLTGTTLGSLTDTWTYNAFGEPTGYSAVYGGTPVYAVGYSRDALGRILTRTETIGGVTQSYRYEYDPAGRLASVQWNGATIAAYTYDLNGNRLSDTGAGGQITGIYDNQDRLLQSGGTAYTYTANGELQSKTTGGQTTAYQYDELGSLLAVTLPGGKQIAYLVDGQNRRIGKRVNGNLVQGFLS